MCSYKSTSAFVFLSMRMRTPLSEHAIDECVCVCARIVYMHGHTSQKHTRTHCDTHTHIHTHTREDVHTQRRICRHHHFQQQIYEQREQASTKSTDTLQWVTACGTNRNLQPSTKLSPLPPTTRRSPTGGDGGSCFGSDLVSESN